MRPQATQPEPSPRDEDDAPSVPRVSRNFKPWDGVVHKAEHLNAVSPIPSPARLWPQRDVELPCKVDKKQVKDKRGTKDRGSPCPHYRGGWCYVDPSISYQVSRLAWCPRVGSRGSDHSMTG